MRRPPTLLAMSGSTRAALFDAGAMAQLANVADVDTRVLVTDFGSAALVDRLRRVELLVTGWGCPPITPQALAGMPALRAIVHAAGTVKTFVSDACWQRGILVSSAASANAIPVAEYTVAAILFAGKHVLESAVHYRVRRTATWSSVIFPDMGNYQRTVGVIGASRIGRLVVHLLRDYDLRVLIHDPYRSGDAVRALGAEPADLDELMARSDVVSIHAPETPATYRMIDEHRLALMRDDAVLINTARGSLVDTAALTAELASGRLRAVLDVTDPEPLPAGSPLFDLPNVLLTPHIAGSLGNEMTRLAHFAIEEVARFGRGEPFRGAVSQESLAVSA